jgi:hypothetical protein
MIRRLGFAGGTLGGDHLDGRPGCAIRRRGVPAWDRANVAGDGGQRDLAGADRRCGSLRESVRGGIRSQELRNVIGVSLLAYFLMKGRRPHGPDP